MKEFDFIRLLADNSLPAPRGIGDDAALYGENTLIAVDMAVEGIHFLPGEPLDNIMMRLFTANISDIAAMGGEAGHYSVLLSIALPPEKDKKAVAGAVKTAVDFFNARLIGGDTSSTKSGLVLSLTILGRKGKNLLLRSGAKPGDILYLSRPVGRSRYELEKRLRGHTKPSWQEFLPESDLGALFGVYGANACIDISDGLGRDASHLAEASGVKIVIEEDRLPVAELPVETSLKTTYALSSGEEYALLIAVSPDKAGGLEKEVKEKLGRVIYPVGFAEAGEGCVLQSSHGAEKDISSLGYQHG